MVASNNTVEEIYKLVQKYVPKNRIAGFLLELREVPGNKSFRDTIDRLCALHEEEAEHGDI